MYEKPNLEIIKFNNNVDVITASSPLNTPGSGDGGWQDGSVLD